MCRISLLNTRNLESRHSGLPRNLPPTSLLRLPSPFLPSSLLHASSLHPSFILTSVIHCQGGWLSTHLQTHSFILAFILTHSSSSTPTHSSLFISLSHSSLTIIHSFILIYTPTNIFVLHRSRNYVGLRYLIHSVIKPSFIHRPQAQAQQGCPQTLAHSFIHS